MWKENVSPWMIGREEIEVYVSKRAKNGENIA